MLIDNHIKYKDHECEENLECQAFYTENRIKLSIGLSGESWGYIGDKLYRPNNDYDIEYLDNGMAYKILEETKTEKYVFGIAWIDDLGYYDNTEEDLKRDIQTWDGADPALRLK